MPRKKGHPKMPEKYRLWKEVRERLHLSDALVCMALLADIPIRKVNKASKPEKLIRSTYFKKTGRQHPEEVVSLEELTRRIDAKRRMRKSREAESGIKQVSQATKRLRMEAHRVASALWKNSGRTEVQVRRWLATQLGLKHSTCRFQELTDLQLKRAIEICKNKALGSP